jgi:hypothetical protein
VFTQWFFGVLITSVVVGAGVLVLARVLVDRWRAARAEYFQKLDEEEETRKKEQEALAVAKAKKLQLAGLMPPKKPSKVAPNSFPDTPPPANLVTRQSLEDLRSKRLVGRQFRDISRRSPRSLQPSSPMPKSSPMPEESAADKVLDSVGRALDELEGRGLPISWLTAREGRPSQPYRARSGASSDRPPPRMPESDVEWFPQITMTGTSLLDLKLGAGASPAGAATSPFARARDKSPIRLSSSPSTSREEMAQIALQRLEVPVMGSRGNPAYWDHILRGKEPASRPELRHPPSLPAFEGDADETAVDPNLEGQKETFLLAYDR